MFYCDKCRDKNKWPDGFMKSYGPCEVCGQKAPCSDIPSGALPKRKEEPKPSAMTLADLIRRRKAFLALSNSDQWSEDAACRIFGLVPGSLNADGIFDMAAKDAEGIADAVVPLLEMAIDCLDVISRHGNESSKTYAASTVGIIRDNMNGHGFTTTEFDNDRR